MGEWVGSRKKYIFGSRDFIVYLAPSLPNCLQKLQNAQAPDSSSPWQGKVVPDLQKGAERVAGRNVKLKGEEKQHDCTLQNAKPAFALFGTFLQVFIPLFTSQHPYFVIYHIISNILNMLYYLFWYFIQLQVQPLWSHLGHHSGFGLFTHCVTYGEQATVKTLEPALWKQKTWLAFRQSYPRRSSHTPGIAAFILWATFLAHTEQKLRAKIQVRIQPW